MNIQGKTAVITGGASGLGAACARMIAEAGGRPVMIDLNEEAGKALAAELGRGAVFVKADVSDAAAMETAMKSVGSPVHIGINCAGIGQSMRTVSKEGPMPLDVYERIIRVNLIGHFNAIRLEAWAISQNEPDPAGERGVIINTASIAAFDGQIGQAAYSASKGGIVGMTLPVARDLSRLGIRVNTIAPGIFDTPLLGRLPEDVRQSLGAQVPFPPRLGQPNEFAALARQIIENTMLNGEVIRLDGALRMAPK
ncbi:MAG: SDR family NAD(P)-dependent oxidoreductase [Bryobacteraceae bacterium]|nr:SDR family NAD(P)-dependent oxidoreductase [Bryobacteraceae bacterium]